MGPSNQNAMLLLAGREKNYAVEFFCGRNLFQHQAVQDPRSAELFPGAGQL